jgi:hypothetical protein
LTADANFPVRGNAEDAYRQGEDLCHCAFQERRIRIAWGLGFETRCELTSNETADKVAKVVRNAENGCYVMQTILKPTPVERQFTLNGDAFDPESFSRGSILFTNW